MMNKLLNNFILPNASLFLCPIILSQDYRIDYFAIGPSSATSRGGDFSLGGEVATLESNQQTLTGGEFYLLSNFLPVTATHSPALDLRITAVEKVRNMLYITFTSVAGKNYLIQSR